MLDGRRALLLCRRALLSSISWLILNWLKDNEVKGQVHGSWGEKEVGNWRRTKRDG